LSIGGFNGTAPLVVGIVQTSPLAGEHEIDPGAAEFVADGLVALVSNGEEVTKYWVPREKIDYVKQVQGSVPPAPTPPNMPAPSEPDAPDAPPVVP
jgi:hypothetical protein